VSGFRLRPKAVEDLEAIGDFIAAEDPVRAVSFIDEIVSLCTNIAEAPRAYSRRDDLAKGLRQAVHGRYLVFFTADDEGIVVERVLHGARRLEDLF
jgi:toxin ParE1/3/4